MAEEKTGCPECGSPMYTGDICDVCGFTLKAEAKGSGKDEKKKA